MPQPNSHSLIEASLIAAYRATHYCVTGTYPPFLLRADSHCPDLEACHRAHGVECSAFVTAWNPLSRPTSLEENVAAQARLEARLRASDVVVIEGLGVDPTGQWEGEESLLALGLKLEPAIAIAREFRQNGLLWAGVDAVPKLILLR